MKNLAKLLTLGYTMASLAFIHIINLINGNIFELSFGLKEKFSILINFAFLGLFLTFALFIINKRSNRKNKVLFNFILFSFFMLFISNQIYGTYDMPIDLAPRSIIVLSISAAFFLSLLTIGKFLSYNFSYVLEKSMMITSPICLIALFSMISLPVVQNKSSVSKIEDKIVNNSKNTSAFIFLFDMLPEYRLELELKRDSLPNFSKLIDDSFRLKKAYSTGTHTVTSINGMFYSSIITEIDRSNDEVLKFKKYGSDSWNTSKNSESIFSDMTSLGYSTNIIGAAHIPFSKWYGEYVNQGYFYVIAPPINSLGSFILYPYTAMYNFLIPNFIKERISPRKKMRMDGLMKALPKIFKQDNSFTYVHFPIPHHEFVYQREGIRKSKYKNVDEGFVDQLYYVDTVLGKLIAELKSNDKYDNSLIIVTSDHGWTTDPIYYKPEEGTDYWLVDWDDQSLKANIPFIMKMPQQKENITINEKFSLVATRDLLKLILKERLELKQVESYLKNYDKNNDLYFSKHIGQDENWDFLKEKVLKIED